MKNIMILLTVLLTACTVNRGLVTVKHKPSETYLKYSMKLPKGYDLRISGGDAEDEYQYIYSDASMIYLTTFMYTPNYNNIKKMGDSILNYRFQNEELSKDINRLLGKEFIKILPDTLELSGIDKDSLYWKDVKIGEISIGYQKVPNEKKKLFDEALKTLKVKSLKMFKKCLNLQR